MPEPFQFVIDLVVPSDFITGKSKTYPYLNCFDYAQTIVSKASGSTNWQSVLPDSSPKMELQLIAAQKDFFRNQYTKKDFLLENLFLYKALFF